jgi:hypothetical protein
MADSKNMTFHIKGKKSYVRDPEVGGAIWYDVIVDSSGQLLDIVTPPDGKGIRCMSKADFEDLSGINLEDNPRKQICILQH